MSGKEKVKSFSWSYFDNTLLLPEIDKIWNRLPLSVYGDKVSIQQINVTIKEGEDGEIFELQNGGRIVGIELDGGYDLQRKSEKLLLKANWDGEVRAAIDVPFNSFLDMCQESHP